LRSNSCELIIWQILRTVCASAYITQSTVEVRRRDNEHWLKDANARLKRLVADVTLYQHSLNEVIRK